MPAAGKYATWQAQTAPPILRGPMGKVIEADFGGEKDIQVERARQGMLVNLPGSGPPDALPYTGAERKLPRAVGESDNDYAERQRGVWTRPDGWSFAGSHGGILFALQRAGFPMGTATGVNIVQRYKRYSYLAGGVVTFGTHAPYTFDVSPSYVFSQFMIVIGADFTPPIGSVFQNGDPSADLFNGLVDEWKPAKWRYMGAVVVVSGLLWGWPPGQLWDPAGPKWGGASNRFILPSS